MPGWLLVGGLGRGKGWSVRSYDDSSSGLRQRPGAFERVGDRVEPALELFREGWGMVGVPGAGVAGGAGGHREGVGDFTSLYHGEVLRGESQRRKFKSYRRSSWKGSPLSLNVCCGRGFPFASLSDVVET